MEHQLHPSQPLDSAVLELLQPLEVLEQQPPSQLSKLVLDLEPLHRQQVHSVVLVPLIHKQARLLVVVLADLVQELPTSQQVLEPVLAQRQHLLQVVFLVVELLTPILGLGNLNNNNNNSSNKLIQLRSCLILCSTALCLVMRGTA